MTDEAVRIVWLRDDLRLADHPALSAAAAAGPVVVLYVNEEGPSIRPLGGAARWWAANSLDALDASLSEHGVRVLYRRGDPRELLPPLAAELGAVEVHVSRRTGAPRRDIDVPVRSALAGAGVGFVEHEGSLIEPLGEIRTGAGEPYSVFTPYWRRLSAQLEVAPPRSPLPRPARIVAPSGQPDGDDRETWGWRPSRPDWSTGLAERWTPGERAAHETLEAFVAEGLESYEQDRDELPVGGSELSPRLRWGELSPAQVWHAARASSAPSSAFLRQLGWREFSYHLVEAFPQMPTAPWRAEYAGFPWDWESDEAVEAWQSGETGVDLVDAAMTELWTSGFMHNRARMVTASYLTKNLLVHWRRGEEWFWDTLVDADAAVNAVSWQWVAGSGPDAAPYFRVLNPMRQQERFDPSRRYLHRWLGDRADELSAVDADMLRAQRRNALEAYEQMRRTRDERTD
ncbi:deoxyribodipyrimidine photo-lyase [Mycetocola reblochoni]|uniref:Deoxyribodipyrimidine photolyase n=2 Tax=Mycetocola reblochoni TaxID=331618 RepID=A0A1R4IXH4_9MICO|nr:deoxyribodipyrimidine photo-lyase [Mycetocola reblochoni]RLP70950.1 deoxyribodipyrimidine photo-lyase [Mycetocola reblochoni]SJN24265.1 Deoxyribodipyrimidine photolyase [Mycetocola reblochoni REB411]